MKQLKSFIPFKLGNDSFFKWLGTAAKPVNSEAFSIKLTDALLTSADPTGSTWGTLGMAQPIDQNSFVHDLDGVARLLVYQFNDRILPGTVLKEKLIERVREVQERDGGKISKKGFAELRDQVEDELLPNSHIRRTLVPVLVYPDRLMIFTTSAKKVDDILAKLARLANLKATVKYAPENIVYTLSIPYVLKQIAGAADMTSDDGAYTLEAINAIKLHGADKRTIAIKDRDVLGAEVQKLLVGDEYEVIELLMELGNEQDDAATLTFSFNERGHFKNVKPTDVSMAGCNKEDMHATCWMMARYFKVLLSVMTDALGGIDEEEL